MIPSDTIHYVVGADGRPMAVQLDLELWRQVLDALEDVEDLALARAALAELEAIENDPDRAGWLKLEDLESTWQIHGAA